MTLTKAQTEVYKQLEEKRVPIFDLQRAVGNMNTDSDFNLRIQGQVQFNRLHTKNKIQLHVDGVKMIVDYDVAKMEDAIARCQEIFLMDMETVKDLIATARAANV